MFFLKKLIVKYEVNEALDSALKESSMPQAWKSWLKGLGTMLIGSFVAGSAPIMAGGHFDWRVAGVSFLAQTYHYIQQSPLPNIPALDAAVAKNAEAAK